MYHKTPSWWTKPLTTFTLLLTPISVLWLAITMLRIMLIRPKKLPIPVLCVGNITAGGTGKTPTVIAIATYLSQTKKVVILTRGYGVKRSGSHLVTNQDTAKDIGDEALLLSTVAPTVIAKDRRKGAELALSLGAEIIIMDDGFQNPYLEKDLSLLVFDGSFGIGNGHIFPQGPLRELPQMGYARAHGILIIGKDNTQLEPTIPKHLPIFYGNIVPKDPAHLDLSKPVLAFAGIGNPNKFFDTLTTLGYTIAERISFPDHYPYKEKELQKLLAKAKRLGATLITTEKDHVRLDNAWKKTVSYLPIHLSITEIDAWHNWLMHHIISS